MNRILPILILAVVSCTTPTFSQSPDRVRESPLPGSQLRPGTAAPQSNMQAPAEASALLKKVGEAYKNLKSYHFEATVQTEMKSEASKFKSESRSEEAFVIAVIKPGRSRVESKGPNINLITISDGKTNWYYLPTFKQFLKRPIETGKGKSGFNPSGVDSGLSFFGFDLIGAFATQASYRLSEYERIAGMVKEAKLLGEEAISVGDNKIECYIIEVEPVISALEESSRKLYWVDKARNIVLRSVVSSKSKHPFGGAIDTTVTINFTLAKIDEAVSEGLFAFVPPPETKEVEKFDLPGMPGGKSNKEMIGKEAIDLSLKDLDGREVSLKSLRGKVVLLDFWATWCGPCLFELPHIEKLYREFKDQGLVVLGINDEESEVVREFMKKNGYTFTTLVDSEKEASKLYEIEAIPQVFVIGRDGKIAGHYSGAKSEGELRAALEKAGLVTNTTSAAEHVTVIPPAPRTRKVVESKQSLVRAEVVILRAITPNQSGSPEFEVLPASPPVRKVLPKYPSMNHASEASGIVQVLVYISESGKVIKTRFIHGHSSLREASLQAAKQWAFTPPRIDGAPAKSQGILTFYF